MSHQVFISYSSIDKSEADAVCDALESGGIECWMAPRDIVPGSDWGESIIDAIERSRVMVLVFSANANASPQIPREVERAVHKGVSIIPFRIEDVAPEKSMEYFISTAHWLDAFDPEPSHHLPYLTETVQARLAGSQAPKPTRVADNAKPVRSKRSYAIAGAVLLAILGILFVLRTPAAIESGMVGAWESSDPSGAFRWHQVNQRDGQFEIGTIMEERGIFEIRSQRLLYLLPANDRERLISWDPQGNGKVVATPVPNAFWIYIGMSTQNRAAGDIVAAATNMQWSGEGDGLPSPGAATPQQWHSVATLAGQTWKLSIEFGNGAQYVFRATSDDTGKLAAKDGEFTAVNSAGITNVGRYQFMDDDTIALTGSGGIQMVWKRAEQ